MYFRNSFKSLAIIVFLVLGCTTKKSDIPERLGYSKDAKLLIIHADDLGVTHSENMASIKGMEDTPVNSASIMVPCPWFNEIAEYARENPKMDFGLHLTLNSEWKYYKWGPVTSIDSVPTLVNEKGHLYPTREELNANASPEEVELELRNQVKKALKSGIDVTHLDAHMSAAVSSPEFAAAYIKVGKEFDVPVFLAPDNEVVKSSEVQSLLMTKRLSLMKCILKDLKNMPMGQRNIIRMSSRI
ncbi:polysaccharide deacetylase family protein [Maribacter halichondriae]|uniref:polysaccharide deacetylase family protein n=1 Tax=Maribacter halichondriae TaxID=2980554 RepID=UPI0023597D72|nr:polysaccharide deacetylase family protein [Maribacter sp. Hal144]